MTSTQGELQSFEDLLAEMKLEAATDQKPRGGGSSRGSGGGAKAVSAAGGASSASGGASGAVTELS